jgi:hypothetical protein
MMALEKEHKKEKKEKKTPGFWHKVLEIKN